MTDNQMSGEDHYFYKQHWKGMDISERPALSNNRDTCKSYPMTIYQVSAPISCCCGYTQYIQLSRYPSLGCLKFTAFNASSCLVHFSTNCTVEESGPSIWLPLNKEQSKGIWGEVYSPQPTNHGFHTWFPTIECVGSRPLCHLLPLKLTAFCFLIKLLLSKNYIIIC